MAQKKKISTSMGCSALEHKAFKFELESTDDSGEFSGYAAVFGNVDSGGDVIEKGAFAKSIAENFDRIKILSQHDGCELPIGKPLELREDAKGLFIRGKISDTQKGRDIRTLLKDGVLTELSIGYDAVVFDYDGGTPAIRHLREIKLWEVSIVTWAMNEEAKIDEVKSLAEDSNPEAQIDEIKSLVEGIKEGIQSEVKGGKFSRTKLDALKPFIAVVRELVDILSPLLEQNDDTASSGEQNTQSNVKQCNVKQSIVKQTKNSGVMFKIIPNKNRR